MATSPLGRSALIVDLASLKDRDPSARSHTDLGRLREHLAVERRLVRSAAYGVVDANQPTDDAQVTWLARNGFKVVTRPLRRRADGTLRASAHVELVVDALELAPHLDVLTIVTSDSDLAPLIEAVQRRGVRVELITADDVRPATLTAVADTSRSLADAIGGDADRDEPQRQSRVQVRPRASRVRAPQPSPVGDDPSGATSEAELAPKAPERSPAPKPEPAPKAPERSPAPKPEPAPKAPERSPAPKPEPAPEAPERSPAPTPRPAASGGRFASLPQERLSGRSVDGAPSEDS